MSLADIMVKPKTRQQENDWAFSHRLDHELIRQSIQAQHNINLPVYQLDPVNWDSPKSWIKFHAAAHDDANGVLKTEASDLETINWSDPQQRDAWLELHLREHRNWHSILKV